LVKCKLIRVLCEKFFIVAFMFSVVMQKLEKQNINLIMSCKNIFLFALYLIASENIKLAFKYFYNYSIILYQWLDEQ
jgi:hypothetical protein